MLLFLLLSAWIFIQTPYGQNWIVKRVTNKLSRELNTRITIRHVDFTLFNHMHLEGLLMEDQKKDTLLYAGDVKVRITDWFFFKDKVELKYVGLEDAYINFNRTDSVWNHQFLFDYLSPSSSSPKKNTSGGIELNLKKLEMKNIRFIQSDKWSGQDQVLQLKSLNLDAEEINFKTKKVDINLLEISDPLFSISDYAKLKPASTHLKEKSPLPDSVLKWNAAGWLVQLDKLIIKNGILKTNKDSGTPAPAHFDGRHILFREIDATFTNVNWNKDTITTDLELKTKEQSGLEVKKMIAGVKFTPQLMEFRGLDLQTNRSRIGNYYSMQFDSYDDLAYFISRVKLEGDFVNTQIDSDDIAFFATPMRDWKKNIELTGKIKGTIEELSGKNLFIKAGNNTLLNGDISMSGLPDINTTFIDFKSNEFKTTYADAVRFIPSLRKVTSPKLNSISYLNFKGNFTGFIRDFVTFGTIQTNLGTVTSDLNMKLPAGKEPIYSGSIASTGFDIGSFLGNRDMGVIALNANLKGSGFTKNVNADIDGKIHSFVYNGYHYENIEVKGKLDNKLFEGSINSADSNAVFFAKGTVDFNKKKPVFNLDAEIQDIQFQKLRIANEDYAFSGRLSFDFQGDNIDDFLGTAHIINGKIYKNGKELPFDTFSLRSEIVNGEKRLTITSDNLEAYIAGQFNINSLPDAITVFLNKYYPAFIPPPKKIPANQSFVFDLKTHDADPILNMFNDKVTGFNESHISGKVDMNANKIELNADVPTLTVSGLIFNNAKISGTGNNEKLLLTGSASSTKINDSISLQATSFTIEAANDISKVSINTASNQEINSASINAVVSTYNDGFKVHFDSSHFDVNKKTWTIDKDGELEFRRKVVTNSELTLREGEQEIRVSTEPSDEGSHNNLKVVLKKLNLGDLTPYFLPQNTVMGLASGNIYIEDPAKKFDVRSDINLEKLWFDKDSIGDLNTNLTYTNKTGILTGKGKNNDEVSKLDFDLLWHLNKDSSKAENAVVLDLKDYPIKILERFIGSLFSDVQGYATGKIRIAGTGNKMNYTGKARLRNGGLKVNFTQCFYKIEDTDIELRKNDINLDGIVLRDPVTNNPIYLDGNISHTYFRDMFYDIRVQTRKPFTSGRNDNRPVLLLNTAYKDNKQFYGKAYGTGSLQLSGPQDDMFMQISAIASDRDSSFITIPPSRTRETGEASFLIEKKYGREMSDVGISNTASNILFDADITANPMVSMRVQIDDLTGDEIKGRGEGTLNIRSGTTEPLTIRGRYNITSGNYVYTFQSIFKKPFIIKSDVGSNNYIEWFGDPYKAKINFEATYTAEQVSFAQLVSGFDLNENLASIREDVIITAKMTNELFDPRFNFKIGFPENSQVNRDQSLRFNISQIENNQNELNRQVTFLIVFNSFAPPETPSSTSNLSGALSGFLYSGINSISGILFNQISGFINDQLYKIFKTDKIKLNVSAGLYNRNVLNQTGTGNSLSASQGNINVNLPISFLKGRLTVNAGLTSEIALGSNTVSKTLYYKNFNIELLINPSGSLRATLFYRENPDFATQNSLAKRQGLGLTYKRESNRFWDLFGFGKKKNTTPVPVLQPATTDTIQKINPENR